MRKLIFILVLAIVAIAARGQTQTYNLEDGTYKNVTTDYTITNTTAIWFLFKAAKNNSATQDFCVTLTKGTGSHSNIDVTLYGRKFSTTDWVQIGSTISSGVITTTYTGTISNTVHNRYREYKVLYQGTGTGTTTISNQELKTWMQ